MSNDYDASKKIALKVILILGVITLAEVFFALLGKGYVVEGMHWPVWLMGILMIILSLTKAIYIVFEFMHMKYEVPGLARSVLLPMLLLVWGVIAFLYEGSAWGNNRDVIDKKNKENIEDVGALQSFELYDYDQVYYI